jgi:hypothetical protein
MARKRAEYDMPEQGMYGQERGPGRSNRDFGDGFQRDQPHERDDFDRRPRHDSARYDGFKDGPRYGGGGGGSSNSSGGGGSGGGGSSISSGARHDGSRFSSEDSRRRYEPSRRYSDEERPAMREPDAPGFRLPDPSIEPPSKRSRWSDDDDDN